MDVLTKEQRCKNMKAIKCRDTEIEVILRNALWIRGYRYRKNCKDVFGKPDIVFKKKKIAIFCDSKFWHGYDWENQKKRIGTNSEFWIKKIAGNIKRDKTVNETLTVQGWKVLRFWDDDIKTNINMCIALIEKYFKD